MEPRFNLVYVVGQVPGGENAYVTLRDAQRKRFLVPPPFPTYMSSHHVCICCAPEAVDELRVHVHV